MTKYRFYRISSENSLKKKKGILKIKKLGKEGETDSQSCHVTYLKCSVTNNNNNNKRGTVKKQEVLSIQGGVVVNGNCL